MSRIIPRIGADIGFGFAGSREPDAVSGTVSTMTRTMLRGARHGNARRSVDVAENFAAGCDLQARPHRYDRLPADLQGCPVLVISAGGLVVLDKPKCSCRVLSPMWPV
jgi:hypothetical protein